MGFITSLIPSPIINFVKTINGYFTPAKVLAKTHRKSYREHSERLYDLFVALVDAL